MIRVNIKLSDDFSKKLDAVAKGIGSYVVRSTARAGALVYYETLIRNTPVGPTGNLKRSIYHAFANEASTPYYKEYQVGFRGNYGGKRNKDEDKASSSHLHLVEFGHIQRYVVRQKKNGWVTLVRPDKIGTPKPNPKTASQADMDAYYIPLKGGPKQVPGKGFVRRSFDEAKSMAPIAMEKRAKERLNEIVQNPALVNQYVD